MLKVLLLLDCDLCRCLFRLSHSASDDPTAQSVHADSLFAIADSEGWSRSVCGNFHYCRTCSEEVEEYERFVMR